MEAEKINGTKIPEGIHFGEPGIDYPPYITLEQLKAITPKCLPKIKGLGKMFIFGTAGENINPKTFEDIWHS